MLVTVRRLGLREGRKRNVPRQPRDFVWLSGGGGDEGDFDERDQSWAPEARHRLGSRAPNCSVETVSDHPERNFWI